MSIAPDSEEKIKRNKKKETEKEKRVMDVTAECHSLWTCCRVFTIVLFDDFVC